jgi:hypothetical protein
MRQGLGGDGASHSLVSLGRGRPRWHVLQLESVVAVAIAMG